MRIFLMIIGCILCHAVTAQNNCFPENKAIEYLLANGQLINKQQKNSAYHDDLNYVELIGQDTVAIYQFTAKNITHSLSYLMLKQGHVYRILNCENIFEDWAFIWQTLLLINKDNKAEVIDLIISTYKTHHAPSWRMEWPKGKEPKPKYLPSTPFEYKCGA